MTKTLPVLSFAKLDQGMPMPHLLDIQTRAFQSLLQPDGKGAERTDVGLERVFKDVFPIQDVNGNYSLEFVKYGLGEPKYAVEECIERDMTYSVPLKATLQLVVMEEVGETTKTKRPKNIIEKEVYLGELPILTPLGTFVINGAERVIVSQLHRSPGVVFEESIHPNGQRLFSARIIPFRGSWVEFTIDIHDVIYVHIDKKKKFPATALLRAFGYGTNAEILKLFYALKEIDITGKLEGRAQRREVLGTLRAADVPDPENKRAAPLAGAGRGTEPRDRAPGAGAPVLPSQALRPGAGGPLQDQSATQARGPEGPHGPHGRGLHRDRPLPDRAAGRARLHRRHRPPRQPAGALGRRADREPVLGGPLAHGPTHQGADEHQQRSRAHHPGRPRERAHRERRDPGVLRQLAAVAVHGPDEPARRADAQAPPLGPRAGRPHARACGFRGARRALQPVRPHVPDRDAGRPQHRAHHEPVVLRARQRPRLHRDAVPGGEGRPRGGGDPLALGVGGGGGRGGAGTRPPYRGRL